MSNFRPSLTKAQLHDIGQRLDARDIPALLWEIARLRAGLVWQPMATAPKDGTRILALLQYGDQIERRIQAFQREHGGGP